MSIYDENAKRGPLSNHEIRALLQQEKRKIPVFTHGILSIDKSLIKARLVSIRLVWLGY